MKTDYASVIGNELRVPGEKPKKLDSHAAAVAALKKLKFQKTVAASVPTSAPAQEASR